MEPSFVVATVSPHSWSLPHVCVLPLFSLLFAPFSSLFPESPQVAYAELKGEIALFCYSKSTGSLTLTQL